MSDPAKREDLVSVGTKLYLRCDSVFAPVSGMKPNQCVRVRGHEGHHCDEGGRQWRP